MLRTKPWRIRGGLGIAAAVSVLLATSAARAETVEVEVDLERKTPIFSRRLTYGTTLNLVVRLPAGSKAAVRYWPHKKDEMCEAAYQALTGASPLNTLEDESGPVPESRPSVETRLGVAGSVEPGKPVRYTFTVDRLLVGLPYCFQFFRTNVRELDAATKDAVQQTLRSALDATLQHLGDGQRYQGRCGAGDIVAIKERGELRACMVSQEFEYLDPSLAELRVQHPDHGDPIPLREMIARELREDEAALADAQRYVTARDRATTRDTTWAEDVRVVKALPVAAQPPAIRAALASLATLTDAPDVARKADVQRAIEAVCKGPNNYADRVQACARLEPMGEVLARRVELDQASKLERFAAFGREMLQVRQVEATPTAQPTVDPPFAARFPLYVSLDVGVAAIPVGPRGVVQYFGVNLYFRPVDRDEPLRERTWKRHPGREFGRRLSLSLGVTTTGASLRSEDGVIGVLGNQFVLGGVGLRITDMLRVSVGALGYRQTSRNPAGGRTRGGATLFIGFSLDLDVVKWISGRR